MKKLVSLNAALLALSATATAQHVTQTGEPGVAKEAGGMVHLGREGCPGGGLCYDPSGSTVGEVGDPILLQRAVSSRRGIFGITGGPRSSSSTTSIVGWRLGRRGEVQVLTDPTASDPALIDVGTGVDRSTAAGTVGNVGGQKRDARYQTRGRRLGRFGQAKGLLDSGALIDVGTGVDRSTAAGTVGNVGGQKRDARYQTRGRRLGRFGQARGLLDSGALIDVGTGVDRSTAAGSASLGKLRRLGNPRQKPADAGQGPRRVDEIDDPTVIHHEPGVVATSTSLGSRRLGTFDEVSLGPLPGGDPLEEEGPSITGVARKVVVYGQPGVEYALYVLPMGSSEGPAILVSRGTLFGEDPSDTPRTFVLRVPAEYAVMLVPLH